MSVIKSLQSGSMQVKVYDSRDSMGRAAAAATGEKLRALLAAQPRVNIIFAAAPSQNETLKYLALEQGIDWQRVHAFHMDEYTGLKPGAPQAFGNYLKEHIFSLLPFGSVNYLNGQAADAAAECERYSALLRDNPVDIVCLGIGENGHIAFNDPGVADFDDPALVKLAPLDAVCRQQQVNDGCFDSIDEVPTHAMTLTIPALTRAKHLICTVPAATKAWAVEHTVTDPISESVPATIMRRHADATLFCDPDSGAGLLSMPRPVRIAFAGLRHNHIFTLVRKVRENPFTEIAGAWEEDAAAAEAGRAQFTEPFYPTYEALLADPDVDAVAMGDYYGIRGERIIQALKAGKHVISDKPVCTSLDEIDEIERLCGEKGLVLSCMLTLRYDPALRLAREIILGGQLGEIRDIMFTGQHPLIYGERAAWYFEEGKHGGTFNDIAIHGVDAVRFITGLEFGRTICARTWNSFAVHAPAFPDCAQYMGAMANGAGIMADVSYAAPSPSGYSLPNYWRFTFWGENGWLECRLKGDEVSIALTGDTAARTIAADAVEGDYLDDMLREMRGEKVTFDTGSVIAAARAVLTIQAHADKYGKEV